MGTIKTTPESEEYFVGLFEDQVSTVQKIKYCQNLNECAHPVLVRIICCTGIHKASRNKLQDLTVNYYTLKPFIKARVYYISCLPVSTADNPCKQFGPRSGPANVWLDLDLNCLALIVFLKEVFHKDDFENDEQAKQNVKNYPACRIRLLQ